MSFVFIDPMVASTRVRLSSRRRLSDQQIVLLQQPHRWEGSLVVAICVFSHWILDFVTHRPDLPLAFGDTVYFGLSLWNSVSVTIAVETALFFAGIFLYVWTTSARDKTGFFGFWSLISVLVIIYVANVFGPPPDDFSIGIAGNASWLFVVCAYWVDRHRKINE
jgi:hypothetical protein